MSEDDFARKSIQRTVSAAGSARPAGGVSSVFALGSLAAAPAPTGLKQFLRKQAAGAPPPAARRARRKAARPPVVHHFELSTAKAARLRALNELIDHLGRLHRALKDNQ